MFRIESLEKGLPESQIINSVYISLFLFSRGVAEAKGTNLLATVWTPNIIFSVLGAILYKFLPK